MCVWGVSMCVTYVHAGREQWVSSLLGPTITRHWPPPWMMVTRDPRTQPTYRHTSHALSKHGVPLLPCLTNSSKNVMCHTKMISQWHSDAFSFKVHVFHVWLTWAELGFEGRIVNCKMVKPYKHLQNQDQISQDHVTKWPTYVAELKLNIACRVVEIIQRWLFVLADPMWHCLKVKVNETSMSIIVILYPMHKSTIMPSCFMEFNVPSTPKRIWRRECQVWMP